MTRKALARRIAQPYLTSQQRGEAAAPPQPEGLARILAGCFVARQPKTTAGILLPRAAHPAKIRSSAAIPASDLVHHRIASTRRLLKCMIVSRCSAAKESIPAFYRCRGHRKSRTQSAAIETWNPRQQMCHHHPTLEKQAVAESPTMGSFVPNAISVRIASKGIGCNHRARLWNRPASVILDLVLSVCVFAACSGTASAQPQGTSSTASADYGELNRPIKVRVNYTQANHARKATRKANRYVRHTSQRHSHWRSRAPRYVAQPALVGRSAALSAGPGGYPWRRSIVTTIFWIGERPRGNNPVPNARSSWDRYWYYNYGGYDNPDPGARRNFIPVHFVPHQNPFYFALPYNDVQGGHTKYEASRVIPWFKQAFARDGQSVLKDRWIAVHHGDKVCYAQWEDCGPFRTDDWPYVFGKERP